MLSRLLVVDWRLVVVKLHRFFIQNIFRSLLLRPAQILCNVIPEEEDRKPYAEKYD